MVSTTRRSDGALVINAPSNYNVQMMSTKVYDLTDREILQACSEMLVPLMDEYLDIPHFFFLLKDTSNELSLGVLDERRTKLDTLKVMTSIRSGLKVCKYGFYLSDLSVLCIIDQEGSRAYQHSIQGEFIPTEFKIGHWDVAELVEEDVPIAGSHNDDFGLLYSRLEYIGSVVELRKNVNLDMTRFKDIVLDCLQHYYNTESDTPPNFVQVATDKQTALFLPSPNTRFNCLYWYEERGPHKDVDIPHVNNYIFSATGLVKGEEKVVIHWFEREIEKGSTIVDLKHWEVVDSDVNDLSMLIKERRVNGCQPNMGTIRIGRGLVGGREGNA